MCHNAFDTHDQLLADDIGHQVFLGGVDMIGQPKNADPVKKGKDDLIDRFVDAL